MAWQKSLVTYDLLLKALYCGRRYSSCCQCLRDGILARGPIIEQFEQKISRYVVARYAIELHKLHEFILAVYGNPPPQVNRPQR
jgi:hypothetical protein